MALIIGLAAALGRWQSALLEWLIDVLNDLLSDVMGLPAGHTCLFGDAGNLYRGGQHLQRGALYHRPHPRYQHLSGPGAGRFFSVHYFGIREKGAKRYLKDMATPIFTLPLELIGQLSLPWP